jgi:hypothetical protein
MKLPVTLMVCVCQGPQMEVHNPHSHNYELLCAADPKVPHLWQESHRIASSEYFPELHRVAPWKCVVSNPSHRIAAVAM